MHSDAIEVVGLTKKYGSTVAVESLTFSVPVGQFVGLLGPNGAGKSTTIGCLTGLLDPTDGVISLFGRRFDPYCVSLKRRLGVMPERLGLFDYLYVDEYLRFQARMYGLDTGTARRRIEELIDSLSLATATARPLGMFSAGMRKKVAFAAAVIHSPDILVLDEPFESIDPAGVALLKDWLAQFVTSGRTVLLTTHVLDTAERVCDRAIVINTPGRIVWDGELHTLRTGGHLLVDGTEFTSLEQLFLEKTGRRCTGLSWL